MSNLAACKVLRNRGWARDSHATLGCHIPNAFGADSFDCRQLGQPRHFDFMEADCA